MKRKNDTLIWLILPLILVLASCDPFGHTRRISEPIEEIPDEVDGWAPVYATGSNTAIIKSTDPQPIVKGGKIYVKDKTVYQIEAGKGIHVIDITDGNNPQKLKFIQVTGAQEMAIKDDNLYTNNINDLVVLDITDYNNVQVVDRVSGVFHLVSGSEPPGVGYYECVDYKKGEVVGWEQKTLYRPQCRKF